MSEHSLRRAGARTRSITLGGLHGAEADQVHHASVDLLEGAVAQQKLDGLTGTE